jgi:ABC-type antimicrobial peptide transport system permease subunit
MLGLFGYFSRKENRQEILLLKEEGATKKNIRRSFGFANLIMLAIILHLSLIGTWMASVSFIDSTRDNLYYGPGFMVQSWWMYFLIIGLASLFVLISYSILMLHSKKMMRERS